jgi:hypothetical protein
MTRLKVCDSAGPRSRVSFEMRQVAPSNQGNGSRGPLLAFVNVGGEVPS